MISPSRRWFAAFLVAHLALAEWLRGPGWPGAAVAAGLLLLTAWLRLRQTPRRPLLPLLLLAQALVVGYSQVRIARIVQSWPAAREARILAARDHLEDVLREARHRADRVAEAAADRADEPLEDAFDRLPALIPARGVETGAALLEAHGRPLAWAGRHRLPPEADGDSIGFRSTPFYAVLESRRHHPSGRVAVGSVLLAADSTVPDRAQSLAQLFLEETEVGLRVLAPGTAPDTSDVFDYVQPTVSGQRLLFSTLFVPPTEAQAYERSHSRAIHRAMWLLVATLLVGLVEATAGWERSVVALLPLVLMTRLPLGEVTGLAPLFGPGLFAQGLLGPLSERAGPLAYAGAVIVVLGLAWRDRIRGRLSGALVSVVLVLGAPYLVSRLASGIPVPASGASTTLWLTRQLTIFLATAGIIVVAGALAPRMRPRRADRWLPVVGAGLGIVAALVGLEVWNARFGWPDWYPFLWTPAILAVVLGFERRSSIPSLAVVAGSAAALVVWGAGIAGGIQAARADLNTLGRTVHPVADSAVGRFRADLARGGPPQTPADLFAIWRASPVSRLPYPTSLGLWRADGRSVGSVALHELDIPDSLVARLVLELPPGTAEAHHQENRIPSAYHVALFRIDSSRVVSVTLGPETALIRPSRFGELIVSGGLPPLYQLTLSPGSSLEEAQIGAPLWWREGWTARGHRSVGMGSEVRDVTGRVALGTPGGIVVRGVLVLFVDLVVLTLLALIADRVRGRAWVRPGWMPELRSFRSRIALALGVFFFAGSSGFAIWNLVRLDAERRERRDLVIAQVLRDAAPSGAVARNAGAPLDDVLRELSDRVGANLALYRDGRLVASSSRGIFEELGLLSPLMDPDAYHRIALDGDASAEADGPSAAFRIRIGFHNVQSPTGDPVILASPQRADDAVLEQQQRDLVMVLLLAVLLGAGGALVGARISARALARPVAELRDSALAFGRGGALVRPSRPPPAEFEPVFEAFEKMAADVRTSRTAEERAARVLAWGEMANQVAHEIKNPLTPMRLGVQHLLRVYRDGRGPIGPVLEETSARILGEIDRLDRIARAFSRFAAPGAGGAPLEPTRLAEVAHEVVDLYRLAPDEGEVIVEAIGSPVEVMARRDEVKETLVNLIENARNAHARRIVVRIEGVRFSVIDDGVGIPPDRLGRIFEPRFSTTTSGSGLGLAIVKRLVEGWGATIEVRSQVGKGTEVIIDGGAAGSSAA
ncbi:MAG: ATP-binding protein [Gemmatimonadota bacterium]